MKLKRKAQARKRATGKRLLPKGQAVKVIPRAELNTLKNYLRLAEEELHPRQGGRIFEEPSKSISVNIPSVVVNGFYDPFLSPGQRKRLKARAREIISKVDDLDQRKFHFIAQVMRGQRFPLEEGPKTLSDLITFVGRENFVREGTGFIHLENEFAKQYRVEFKEALNDLVSFSKLVLRSVRKK